MCLKTLGNQSTESADGTDCLKFYWSLEVIAVYAEIKVFSYTG